MLTREAVFDHVRSTMQELFDVGPERIQLDTKLIEDLDLDSIDAIDLAARLEEITHTRLPEETLRGLRTVEDVVTLVYTTVNAEPVNADTPAGEGAKE